MLVKAILVGLIAVFHIWDSRLLGRLNFEQPLITCTLVGLVLGDLQTGLAIGATMQLVALGLLNIGAGGNMAMGVNVSSIIGCAFVILGGIDIKVALTLIIAMAPVVNLITVAYELFEVQYSHWCDRAIERGDFSTAKKIHIILGPFGYAVINFFPVFLAIYFGTDFFSRVTGLLPDFIVNGLTLGSNIITLYGIALLLSTALNKKNVVFLLLGFLICAFSGLSLTAMSFIGAIIAIILYGLKYENAQAIASNDDL